MGLVQPPTTYHHPIFQAQSRLVAGRPLLICPLGDQRKLGDVACASFFVIFATLVFKAPPFWLGLIFVGSKRLKRTKRNHGEKTTVQKKLSKSCFQRMHDLEMQVVVISKKTGMFFPKDLWITWSLLLYCLEISFHSLKQNHPQTSIPFKVPKSDILGWLSSPTPVPR